MADIHLFKIIFFKEQLQKKKKIVMHTKH